VTFVRTLVDSARMQTRGFKRAHDLKVWTFLKWLQEFDVPVINFGKSHIAGAAKGNNRMGGWDMKDDGVANFIQQGISDNHLNTPHWDYGTNTYGELDE